MAQQRQQGKEAHGATAGPPYRTLLEFVAWSVAEVQAQESKATPAPCADFLQRELPSVQDAARRVKVFSDAPGSGQETSILLWGNAGVLWCRASWLKR